MGNLLSNPLAINSFNKAAVEALSSRKKEPSWMTERRLEAWKAYEAAPLSAETLGFPLQDIRPFTEPPTVPVPSHLWPSELQHALDERGDEEGLIVQRDSTIQSRSISKEFSKKGVIFSDLDYALVNHPEIVQDHFGQHRKLDNPFSALTTAFWSGGTFLYVPDHVAIHLPFHTCLWMSQPGTGIFSHTLMIVEEGAAVSFIDEGVSAEWDKPGLVLETVEASIGIRACLNYFQLQNWGKSVSQRHEEKTDVNFQGRFLSGRMEKRLATTLEKVAELHPEVRV
jgi:Fe-S cluster assembly scaffold protein SufB